MNPIIEFIESLLSEGLRPSSVSVFLSESGSTCRVTALNMHSIGEGDPLPNHTIEVDRENMPDGVRIGGWERFPDQVITIDGNRKQIEEWMRETAVRGKAPDVAWIGDGSHCVTKPIEWMEEPVRSVLLKKYGVSDD